MPTTTGQPVATSGVEVPEQAAGCGAAVLPKPMPGSIQTSRDAGRPGPLGPLGQVGAETSPTTSS